MSNPVSQMTRLVKSIFPQMLCEAKSVQPEALQKRFFCHLTIFHYNISKEQSKVREHRRCLLNGVEHVNWKWLKVPLTKFLWLVSPLML